MLHFHFLEGALFVLSTELLSLHRLVLSNYQLLKLQCTRNEVHILTIPLVAMPGFCINKGSEAL